MPGTVKTEATHPEATDDQVESSLDCDLEALGSQKVASSSAGSSLKYDSDNEETTLTSPSRQRRRKGRPRKDESLEKVTKIVDENESPEKKRTRGLPDQEEEGKQSIEKPNQEDSSAFTDTEKEEWQAHHTRQQQKKTPVSSPPSTPRRYRRRGNDVTSIREDICSNCEEKIRFVRDPSDDISDGKSDRPLSWDQMFVKLVLYKAQNGDCLVPNIKPKTDPNFALSRWVAYQRAQYDNQKNYNNEAKVKRLKLDGMELTHSRKIALETIGFAWNVTNQENEERWEQRYIELVKFKEEHGHTNVKGRSSLARWVQNQRKTYRARYENISDEDDDDEDEDHEDDDDGEEEDEDERCEGGAATAAKVDSDHDANPSEQFSISENKKKSPRKRWDFMPLERKQKLEELGFVWRFKTYEPWQVRFQELQEFKREHGHVLVPQHYAKNRRLGKWVNRQRTEYGLMKRGKASQLNEERIKLLNEIGFSWITQKGPRKPWAGRDSDSGTAKSNKTTVSQSSSSPLPPPGPKIVDPEGSIKTSSTAKTSSTSMLEDIASTSQSISGLPEIDESTFDLP